MSALRKPGRPEIPKDERRRKLGIVVAPETAGLFREAARRLGKKPGEFLDDLAKALRH